MNCFFCGDEFDELLAIVIDEQGNTWSYCTDEHADIHMEMLATTPQLSIWYNGARCNANLPVCLW